MLCQGRVCSLRSMLASCRGLAAQVQGGEGSKVLDLTIPKTCLLGRSVCYPVRFILPGPLPFPTIYLRSLPRVNYKTFLFLHLSSMLPPLDPQPTYQHLCPLSP